MDLIKQRIISFAKKFNINENIIHNAIENKTIFKNINNKSICVLCNHNESYHDYHSCKFINNNNICKCGSMRSLLFITMPINYMD